MKQLALLGASGHGKVVADAALAATIFHYGEFTIAETKQRLGKSGLLMREATD